MPGDGVDYDCDKRIRSACETHRRDFSKGSSCPFCAAGAPPWNAKDGVVDLATWKRPAVV